MKFLELGRRIVAKLGLGQRWPRAEVLVKMGLGVVGIVGARLFRVLHHFAIELTRHDAPHFVVCPVEGGLVRADHIKYTEHTIVTQKLS